LSENAGKSQAHTLHFRQQEGAKMRRNKQREKIQHVLCPSDLSEKSQKALGFAARLAETLDARLTACHCAPANWFTQENRLPEEARAKIKDQIKKRVAECQGKSSRLRWQSLVIENSFDPARDLLALACEADVDLIVLKARPGVLSAFRFGSIVERMVESAPCPILILPSSFLADRDPKSDMLEFHRILFDYDFSEATDELFRVANTLSRDYHADLHVLSVLQPPTHASTEAAPVPFSRTRVQTLVRGRLDEALQAEGKSVMNVPTAVEWGRHAETVLAYAKTHQIDLICTALAPPHFYFEKLYSSYLGSLLKSATCPILVKQAQNSHLPKGVQ
jgi:nucleotide-binding universal stress UspA family protein